jgi:O-antigen/teichoic acid export membrane protein
MGIDLSQQVASLLVAIPVALITRSAVALVIATLAGAVVRTILTHVALPGERNRFFIEKTALKEILSFGRFIFVSTIFFFIGTRFDVFALGRLEGMGVVGVYGLATMIAAVPAQIGERVSYSVLMPALAERFRAGPAGFADDVVRSRKILLPAAGVLFFGAAVCAPPFFHFFYRDVYADAGLMVRFVVATSWCMFLQEASARALMAIGDTKPLAWANAARVAATIAFCFLGFHAAPYVSSAKLAPMFGFMIGNSLGALVGVLAIDGGLRKHGARIALLDAGATAVFALALVVDGFIQT